MVAMSGRSTPAFGGVPNSSDILAKPDKSFGVLGDDSSLVKRLSDWNSNLDPIEVEPVFSLPGSSMPGNRGTGVDAWKRPSGPGSQKLWQWTRRTLRRLSCSPFEVFPFHVGSGIHLFFRWCAFSRISRTSQIFGFASNLLVEPACHFENNLDGHITSLLIQVHWENADSCRNGHSSGPFELYESSLLLRRERSCTQSPSRLLRQEEARISHQSDFLALTVCTFLLSRRW